jgi:hypothetical protein
MVRRFYATSTVFEAIDQRFERFRETEIVVGGAFRQIRHDIDELRGRR